MKPVAVANLSFCILLMFVADTNSLQCYKCGHDDDGKCKKSEAVTCVAPTPPTPAAAPPETPAPAARFIERDEAPTTVAAEKPLEGLDKYILCYTKKEGEKIFKGCNEGEICGTEGKTPGPDVVCCKTDLCNSGLYTKPSSLFFIVFIVLTSLIISSR